MQKYWIFLVVYLLPIIAVDSNHTWLQSKFDARVVGRYMKAAPRTIQTPQVKKVAYREVTEARKHPMRFVAGLGLKGLGVGVAYWMGVFNVPLLNIYCSLDAIGNIGEYVGKNLIETTPEAFEYEVSPDGQDKKNKRILAASAAAIIPLYLIPSQKVTKPQIDFLNTSASYQFWQLYKASRGYLVGKPRIWVGNESIPILNENDIIDLSIAGLCGTTFLVNPAGCSRGTYKADGTPNFNIAKNLVRAVGATYLANKTQVAAELINKKYKIVNQDSYFYASAAYAGSIASQWFANWAVCKIVPEKK